MAKQEIKFKVTIKELSIEYEGTREVGQSLQAGINRSLGSLLDTQRAAMAIPAPPPQQPTLFDALGQVEPSPNGKTVSSHATGQPAAPTPVPATAAERVKKPRKSPGPSLKGLLRGLIQEGYFKEPRTVDAIREKLKDNGHGATSKALSSRLQEMTQGGELFRQKSGDIYVYRDSKFDDNARNPTPPAEPAQ
jgi:hypothetical protein